MSELAFLILAEVATVKGEVPIVLYSPSRPFRCSYIFQTLCRIESGVLYLPRSNTHEVIKIDSTGQQYQLCRLITASKILLQDGPVLYTGRADRHIPFWTLGLYHIVFSFCYLVNRQHT